MARSILNEFKLELSLLVFAVSIVGLLLVIPPFFAPSFQMPVLHPYVAPTKSFHVWIFLGAAIGFLGGGWYFFSTAQKHWRFGKLIKDSKTRAALKRNIKELEELAPELPSWKHRILDEIRKKFGVK
jgi:hypothetical protein